jgi:hypothetical protein
MPAVPGDLRIIRFGEAFVVAGFYFSKFLREFMRNPFNSLFLLARALGLWFIFL